MATWYLYHGGDNDPGYGPTDRNDPTQSDNWTNAFTTLASAAAAVSAGDRIYVAHDHSEDPASSITYAFPNGTGGAPVELICVNRSTGAVALTAAIVQTGTYTMAVDGNLYAYGMIMRGRTTFALADSSSLNVRQLWEKCTLGTTRAASAGFLIVGPASGSSNGAMVDLKNCTIQFSHSGSRINIGTSPGATICGGSIDVTDAVPTSLLKGVRGGMTTLYGVDLTNLSTGYILDTAGTGLLVRVVGCKGTYNDLSGNKDGCRVERWVDGPSVYNYAVSSVRGSVLRETTVYRSGGASDGGSVAYCQKVVGNAYAFRFAPLDVLLINNCVDLSNKTITVYCARKSAAGAALNSAECWLELGAPDDGSPLWNPYSSAPATPRDAGAAYTSTSETWATLTSPYQWKMTITVPAAALQKGLNCLRLVVAKDLSAANAELYVCPKVDVA